MKTANIFLLGLFLMSSSVASSQDTFTNLALNTKSKRPALTYTVPKEANVYHYRIFAGDDSTSMKLIATLRPKSNSVMPQNYRFELADNYYKYYQVAIVRMNGKISYSKLASPNTIEIKSKSIPIKYNESLGNPLAENK